MRACWPYLPDSIWWAEGSGTYQINEATFHQHCFPWIFKKQFLFSGCGVERGEPRLHKGTDEGGSAPA